MDTTTDTPVVEGGGKLDPTNNNPQKDSHDGVSDDQGTEVNGSDDMELRMKEKENEIQKESEHDVNENKEKLGSQDSDVETKFIAVENKHLRGDSFTSSKGGTPNSTRKRKNVRHGEDISVAEMISLSGMESICTLSNFDAVSTGDVDDDEEAGGEKEEEEEEKKGIQVHHVLAVLLAMVSVGVILILYFLVPCPCVPADWDKEMELMGKSYKINSF